MPLSGDQTSAAELAADPAGWARGPAIVDGRHRVIGVPATSGGSVPTPDGLVQHVLEAAHAASSVGPSQPWRFLVVRDPSIRDRAAVRTDRERLRQAARLDEEAGRRRACPRPSCCRALGTPRTVRAVRSARGPQHEPGPAGP